MTTEPPGEPRGTVKKADDRARIRPAARVRNPGRPALRAVPGAAHAMEDRRLTAETRVAQVFVALRGPIGPKISPDPRTGGDPDAGLPLLGSWPRVFPGL